MEENIQAYDITRHDATERDVSHHTLTIKQAAELFAQLGVSRSPRSIQRFCEIGNLDCIRVKGDKTEHYFVAPLSVERYAEELRQLEAISGIGADVSRHDAPQRDTSRHDVAQETPPPQITKPVPVPEPHDETALLRARIVSLKRKNFQLEIDRAAKEQVIGHMLEKQEFCLEQLIEKSREIGQLEMQLQQLAAPRHDVSRHDATEFVTHDATVAEPEPTVTTVEAPVATQPAADAEPAKSSVWRKIFW